MPRTDLLVDGLDHPEGVAWDPASGILWAGGEAGQLYRVDVDARTWSEAARAPGFVLGLAVDGRGRLAVCSGEARDPDGALDVFSESPPHFPNGCAVTPDGRYLWMVKSNLPTLSRFDLVTGELEEVTRLPGTAGSDCSIVRYRGTTSARVGRQRRVRLERGDAALPGVRRVADDRPRRRAAPRSGRTRVSRPRPWRPRRFEVEVPTVEVTG
jgi:hypothetical protein